MIDVETLVVLAKEVESSDPIDWAMLNIDEDNAYRLIATSVLERFGEDKFLLQNTMAIAMLATITKLIVENFVLNIKLLQKENTNDHIRNIL